MYKFIQIPTIPIPSCKPHGTSTKVQYQHQVANHLVVSQGGSRYKPSKSPRSAEICRCDGLHVFLLRCEDQGLLGRLHMGMVLFNVFHHENWELLIQCFSMFVSSLKLMTTPRFVDSDSSLASFPKYPNQHGVSLIFTDPLSSMVELLATLKSSGRGSTMEP